MQTAEDTDIHKVTKAIHEAGHLSASLPHGGFIDLDARIPYLLIYRKKAEDEGTVNLVRSGASYLIIDPNHLDYFRQLLETIINEMMAIHGAYLMFEIYSGPEESRTFIIRGPAEKLPSSLEVLSEELEKIDTRNYRNDLTAFAIHTEVRQGVGENMLFTAEELKLLGGTLIGLEVPPVYRDDDRNVFPLYFRKFRDELIEALQRSLFEYLRVQTSFNLTSYTLLGKRTIDDEVLEIDRGLSNIQMAYQFLLLIAPVNIQSIRKTFIESNHQELEDYNYRLLPVDPDILKRAVYNLRIEDITDPGLAFLLDEKREEIDHELSMLKERGTRNFFYSSVRLHKGIDNTLLDEALDILNHIAEGPEEIEGRRIDAQDFAALAEEEFAYFKSQSPEFKSKIHVREDVNIMMVSKGEVYIPSDYTMCEEEAQALIQHEIGTHVLTYYNGKQQPLSQLSLGLAGYDPLQEGIAVLAEYFSGNLTKNRLRTLAGRVVAGHAVFKGEDFHGVFKRLYKKHGFTEERSFNITSRMFQGGGFLKDIIYLKGLVELTEYLRNDGDLECLYAGKFALKHVHIINDLIERGILKAPQLMPRYLTFDDFNQKLNKIKQGLPLYKMAK